MARLLRRVRDFGLPLAAAVALVVPLAVAPSASEAQTPTAPDYSNGTIVHIGDSFLDSGLQQALKPKLLGEKTHYISLAKASSYLGEWSVSPDLAKLYFSHRPALFLITLGANETKAPPASRVASVRRLVQNLHGTPCVWVGFPIWKNEPTGLNEMIRRESAPCRYFDSDAIGEQIPRARDKIHPTTAGGAIWAEAVFKWLKAERDPGKAAYWTLKPAPPEEHNPPAGGSAGKAPAASRP